jgi:hypothetical protein
MTKKKDFKGVATNIMGDRIKSLDDFLGSPEPDVPATTNPLKDVSKQPVSDDNHVEAAQNATTADETVNQKEPDKADQTKMVPVEKSRVSLMLASTAIYELDALKTDVRRLVSRADLSKISKSSIVEAAIYIVSADFREHGLNSQLVKDILKN